MGETVNETVKLILSLSVSGGLLAHVLFALTIDERDLMLNMVKSDMQDYLEGLREEELFSDDFDVDFGEELIRVTAQYSNERMIMECEIGNVEGFAPGQHLQ